MSRFKKIQAGKYCLKTNPDITIESWFDQVWFWDVWYKGDNWLGHFRSLKETKEWCNNKTDEEIIKAVEQKGLYD